MPIYSGDIPHCPQLLDYQGNVSQYSIDLAVYLENWLGAYSQDIRNILTEQDFLEYLSSFDDTAVIYAGTGGALSDDVTNFSYNATTYALTITGSYTGENIHISSGETYDTILEADNTELTADHTLTFDLSNADRKLKIYANEIELNYGTFQELKTTSSPTFAGAKICNYNIVERSSLLFDFQNDDSGELGGIEIFTKDGDATDSCLINIFGKGTPSQQTNIEYLQTGWNAADTQYVIKTVKAGSGSARQLVLQVDTNTDQFVLGTNGNNSMSGDLTINDLIIGDGRYIGSASDTDAIQIEADGDVVLTQNLYIPNAFYHAGDGDTGFQFPTDDTVLINAGGLNMIKLYETALGSDALIVNEAGVDIDTRIEAVGQANALFVQGSDGKVGINDNTPSYTLDVNGTFRATGNSLVGGTLGVTGAVTGPAGSAFGGNKVPKKLYVSCEPQLGNGTFSATGVTITNGQSARFNFYIDDYIDASQDIVISFLLTSDEADATEDMLLYVETRKTDNSEAPAWNIENGTAFTFDSTTANQLSKYQYTLAAANYDNDDGILIAIQNNTTTATVVVYSCVFEMVAKDS